MKNIVKNLIFIGVLIILGACSKQSPRVVKDFNANWEFLLGEDSAALFTGDEESRWTINLPHDWSILGEFSENHPTTARQGALPAGIGWYKKIFKMDKNTEDKIVYIEFDGVFCNSEVWINNHYLGKRPNGYISFRYELTPYLKYGEEKNIIVVKADNSLQPNSRWYTGSGIYRNVSLVILNKIHVEPWGTFITTPEINETNAWVWVDIYVRNKRNNESEVNIETQLFNADGKSVGEKTLNNVPLNDSVFGVRQKINIKKPELWSTDRPYLYNAVTKVYENKELVDSYETKFGIRYFRFDPVKGFFLNGKYLKLYGVNLHHDLGALGAAVNKRAIEKRLGVLKEMGCNAIRLAHNPHAPEMLDLCDEMGFLVINEAFDNWRKEKVEYDYHLYWDEWHKKDLEDLVLRDRNHPSVIVWSVGNEMREQFDTTGLYIPKELVAIVKNIDPTRPVTCSMTENSPNKNYVYQSFAFKVMGFNYKQEAYAAFPVKFYNRSLIATENMSAMATRGHYDMPSDTVMRWPAYYGADFEGNPDYTVSAYDQVSAIWGSTHEETWKVIKKYDHISGVFVWAGYDYLGEPEPYLWPARSSYLGIVDLAGFPKDVYYMYQSEWTDKDVLHVFPHWNWEVGDSIDVWAYYNNADEVELFLNGKSLGPKSKPEDVFHVMWRVAYQPGTLKAISSKEGKTTLEKEIHTAGPATKIELLPDRIKICADGKDLSFVSVRILDKEGNLVPDADNTVHFEISGSGFIAGVDNGYQAGLEPFKANSRKAFNGLCLAIVQSNGKQGDITLTAKSDELEEDTIIIECE